MKMIKLTFLIPCIYIIILFRTIYFETIMAYTRKK